jgi:hypothetical protein
LKGLMRRRMRRPAMERGKARGGALKYSLYR